MKSTLWTTSMDVDPSPLGAPEGGGVSQGLGRSGGTGWNFVGFARKAEEA